MLFASYRFDAGTALYAVRNRFLHALLGWITRDPLDLDAGSLSLYLYVGAHPTAYSDAFGTSSWTWVDFIKHYYQGGGVSVTLDSELLSRFLAASSIDLNNIMAQPLLFPSKYPTCDEKEVSSNGSERKLHLGLDSPSRAYFYGFYDAIYILNQGEVDVTWSCVHIAKCERCDDGHWAVAGIFGSCTYWFHFYDRFANVFDRGIAQNGVGYEFDANAIARRQKCYKDCDREYPPSGAPYQWERRGGCYMRCDDRYPLTEFGFPYNIVADWSQSDHVTFPQPGCVQP